MENALLNELTTRVLDRLPTAVTLTDPQGLILYFNPKAAELLDRKPEYIGRDIRFCHDKAESVEKIDRLLASFADGRREDFEYRAVRNGRWLHVTVSPIIMDGRLAACLQTVLTEDGPV